MSSPDLSIIIASHRALMIERCLESFRVQVPEAFIYEIIVVTDYDNSSLQQKYSEVQWLFLDSISISAKRNAGVKVAKAETIAFIDDDCKPLDKWIVNGLTYLNNREYAAVEGLTTIEHTSSMTGAHREYKRLETQGFRTNNIFYKKEWFLKVGGFDERFTVQREDLDLAFSIMSIGGKFAYCKDIRVEHLFRKGESWDLLKNCINRRFDPLLFKKNPTLYRRYVKTPFPPMLLLLLVVYLGTSMFLFSQFALFAILIDIMAITLITLRRTGFSSGVGSTIMQEWIAVAIAPYLLAGTLICGSFRWRKILFI